MSPCKKLSYLHLDEDIVLIPLKKENVECCEEELLKPISTIKETSSDAVKDPFLCEMCNKSLKSQAYLNRHIRLTHNPDSLLCKECGVLKDTWKQLRDHKRLHFKIACNKCGKMVVKSKFSKHIRSCKTKVVVREVKIYKCKFCNFQSKTKFNTQRHETNNCRTRIDTFVGL